MNKVQINAALDELGYGSNLMTNPGGETGDMTGWSGTFLELEVADTPQAPANLCDPHSGTYMFWHDAAGYAADGSAVVGGEQDVDVSGIAAQIDAGLAEFQFRGWIIHPSSPGSGPDQAWFTIRCYANPIVPASPLLTRGGVALTGFSDWTQLQYTFIAPATTRWVRIILNANNLDNNGAEKPYAYFDDMSLRVREPLLQNSDPVLVAIAEASYSLLDAIDEIRKFHMRNGGMDESAILAEIQRLKDLGV